MKKLVVVFIFLMVVLFLTACSKEQVEELQLNYTEIQEKLNELEQDYNDLGEKYEQVQTDNDKDFKDLNEKYEQVQTDLKQTQSDLEQAQSSLEQVRTDNDKDFKDLNDKYEQVQTDLEQAQSDLEQAQSDLEQAQSDLEQAQSDLDQAQTNIELLESDLQKTKTDLDQAQTDLEQAQSNLDQAQTNIELLESDLQKTKTDLDQAQSNLEETKSNLVAAENRLSELAFNYDLKMLELEESINNIDVEAKLFETIDSTSDSVLGIKGYDEFDNHVISGSGVIYKVTNGVYYLVTNYHVIADTNYVKVYLSDNSEENAYLVGYDYYLDIAVLKFNSTGKFPIVEFGDSRLMDSGDFVLAIGSPLSTLQFNSVTLGIISGKNRFVYDNIDDYYGELYIQHDAAINPGNSGGGLFNIVDYSIDGMGFAIQGNAINNVIKVIENGELYKRAHLGFGILTNVNHIRNNPDDYTGVFIPLTILNGVYVDNIYTEGLFFQAGVQDGDIITQIDGQDVNFWYEIFYEIFYEHTILDDFTITIIRNEETMILEYKADTSVLNYFSYGQVNYTTGYYVGSLYNDLEYGQGMYYWNDGSFYIGEWINGEREGYGEMFYSDNDEYYGYWENDLKHGFGEYFHSNGDYYQGYFRAGQLYGYGAYYWFEGDYFVGIWQTDMTAQLGKIYYADGSEELISLIDDVWTSITSNDFLVYDEVYLNSAGQLLYNFTLTSNQTIYAFTDGKVDTYGYLLYGSTIISEVDDGAADSNFLIQQALAPGTYTLVIEGYYITDTGNIDVFVGNLS